MNNQSEQITPHYMDLRMQSDLRAVVAKYIAEGWELVRGKTLEVSKNGESRPVELRDRSGRVGA